MLTFIDEGGAEQVECGEEYGLGGGPGVLEMVLYEVEGEVGGRSAEDGAIEYLRMRESFLWELDSDRCDIGLASFVRVNMIGIGVVPGFGDAVPDSSGVIDVMVVAGDEGAN